MHLIVGDVGGTHARLALARTDGEQVSLLRERVYPSRDYPDLGSLLAAFLRDLPRVAIGWACIGVAGPVHQNRSRITNLPWVLDGATLADEVGLPGVNLLNDLEAAAWGLDTLDDPPPSRRISCSLSSSIPSCG